tara:strand:+ start:277 stop:1383 length:1107 start_codon:yes stop_codon:yes gene_type:complete
MNKRTISRFFSRVGKKEGVCILLALLSVTNIGKVFAVTHKDYTIDVYKTDQITAEEVDQKYGKQLAVITEEMRKLKKIGSAAGGDKMNHAMDILMEGVSKHGSFAYLGLSPVMYPDVKRISFTLDIVDKKDQFRLQGFKKKPTREVKDPNHLIEDWHRYEKYVFESFLETRTSPAMSDCSAFHCIYNFTDPAIKQYGVKFNQEVPKHKQELVDILRNDKDDNKRAAAAFLLAHLKNGNEVITLLVPSMRDPSNQVRNNAMRVMGQTLTKLKNTDFPVEEAVRALQYPTDLDRNKALYIINSLVVQPRYALYIKQHAVNTLLDLLKLEQPNQHNDAYQVLKSISHKNYGDRDYASWKKWAKNHCGDKAK